MADHCEKPDENKDDKGALMTLRCLEQAVKNFEIYQSAREAVSSALKNLKDGASDYFALTKIEELSQRSTEIFDNNVISDLEKQQQLVDLLNEIEAIKKKIEARL